MACKCKSWRRTQDKWGVRYEKSCRLGARRFHAEIRPEYMGSNWILECGEDNVLKSRRAFYNVQGQTGAKDVMPAGDRWLASSCAEASKSASLGGCGCRRGR